MPLHDTKKTRRNHFRAALGISPDVLLTGYLNSALHKNLGLADKKRRKKGKRSL